jgi:hypothetical protein
MKARAVEVAESTGSAAELALRLSKEERTAASLESFDPPLH